MNLPRILRRRDVEELVGLKRSSLYAAIAAGTFPRPVRLTPGAVGWRQEEIEAWIKSRPKTEPERGHL
ncbi:MAG: AlpA family phage regulatory protein [Proteobacteria bacterium]|nr:AlpA family phage regulatory protein [Pseudomonadota bacterium]